MFEVQSFCFFISLRTGTKIVGFISLLGCILASVFSIWELVTMMRLYHHLEVELVIDLLAQTAQIITSVFLLLGAYQEKARLIPPWLVITLVSAVMEVVFMPSLVCRIIGYYHGPFTEWLIITLFLLVDDIYGLLVVFSYYRTLAPQGY